MSKLPTSVKIGPYTYKIFSDKKLDKELTTNGTDGHCANGDHKIAVRNDCPIDRKRVILIHELCHAALSKEGIYLERHITDQAQEWFCEKGSKALLEILRDNPKIVRYLVSKP